MTLNKSVVPTSRGLPPGCLPKAQRREQLLGTAKTHFAQHGYNRTTMEGIADASGVSKPVLYQHFSGKKQLYDAVLERGGERFLAALFRPLSGEMPNKERTREIIFGFVDTARQDQETFSILFDSDMMGVAWVAERVDSVLQRVSQGVSDALQIQARVPDFDARFLARILLEQTISTTRIILATAEEHQEHQTELLYRQVWGGLDLVDADWSDPTTATTNTHGTLTT